MKNVIKYAQLTAFSVILGTTALSGAVAESGAVSPTGGQLNSNSVDSNDSIRPSTSNPTGSATLARDDTAATQAGGNGARLSTDGTGNRADWTREDTYWRQNYTARPYFSENQDYGTYQPAYRYGVNAANDPANANKRFEELDQRQLETGWNQNRGDSTLDWSEARDAVRDSYNRAGESRTGVGMNSAPLDGTDTDPGATTQMR